MKKWETPKVNELGVQATNEDASTFNYPHFWECQTCGKHHEGSLFGAIKPSVCGHNGCKGTEFKWTLCPEHLKS